MSEYEETIRDGLDRDGYISEREQAAINAADDALTALVARCVALEAERAGFLTLAMERLQRALAAEAERDQARAERERQIVLGDALRLANANLRDENAALRVVQQALELIVSPFGYRNSHLTGETYGNWAHRVARVALASVSLPQHTTDSRQEQKQEATETVARAEEGRT